MLIRSQNKKSITTDLNLRIFKNDLVKDGEPYEIQTSSREYIGTYSTEEKAIKVLDMICNACRNIAFIDEKAVVFEMPSDKEVEV